MRSRKGQKTSQKPLLKLEQDMEDAVRIFPFQQFDNVTEVPLKYPISAEPVDSGLFVVPSVSEKIILYGIEEKLVDGKTTAECTEISDFSVVSVSRAVHYLHHTGWLISLERHPTQKTIARIYFNWRTNETGLSCKPERDSIGDVVALSFMPTEKLGKTDEEFMKHKHNVSYIEVPADRNIRRVSVCPTTNRIAFATRNHIRIWVYDYNRMELVYTIKVDFDIKSIDLYGEYLAYTSDCEVRVIRVCTEKGQSDFSSIHKEIIMDETDPRRSSPTEPFTPIEDDHMIECNFSAATGASLEPKRNLIIPTAGVQRSRPTGIRTTSNTADSSFEVLGPSENTHCITPNFLLHYHVKSCVVLIHRLFSSKAFVHTVHFLPEFHLIPEYLGIDTDLPNETKRARILRNIKKQTHQDETEIFEDTKKTLAQINTSRSVRCMIGTSRKGYLYDVSDPRLLSEYSFTEHTISLKMTSSVMYTLTQSSLIMWSIRCCSSAGEKFPAPCVLGMEFVQNPRHLAIVGDYLVVTPTLDIDENESKQPRSNTPATVLRTKSLLSLFDEIRAFAKLNEETSYEAYFQLMLELHFLLEAKLQSLNQRLMQTEYYSLIFKENSLNSLQLHAMDAEEAQELDQLQIESTLYHEKHKESSGALGDYQFRTNLYSRAAVFYADSDRLMSTVIDPLLEATSSESHTSARRGILHYLDAILFNPDKKPIMDESPELSDKILAIYHTFARGRLASVILESYLSKYNQETALRLLEDPRTMRKLPELSQNQKKTRYHHASAPAIAVTGSLGILSQNSPSFQSGLSLKNIFVRGLLYLDLGQPEQAAQDFLSLEAEVLVDFCAQNSQLLIPDLMSNNNQRGSILAGNNTIENIEKEARTPTLGQLLYKSDPWPFLDILVRVIDRIPVETGLRLLNAHCISELSEDRLFILENYLEWILVNGHATIEAYQHLTLIYANHIFSDKQQTNELPKATSESLPEENRKIIRKKWIKMHRDSFIHQRAEWLNQIEPFDGVNLFASRSPFASDDEPLPPMFYLLKIQGLLSTDNLVFAESIKPLLSRVYAEKSFTGKLSLELLCLPLAGKLMVAMEKVINECPHITCLFAVKYCRTNEEWKEVLDFLSSSITSCQVYTEIISHLVRSQDPVSFVSLLPENGNMNFFLPFIEQCFRVHYASALKQSIVNQAKTRASE